MSHGYSSKNRNKIKPLRRFEVTYMSNPVVWFGVLGQHADKMRAFYSSLFGWKFNLDPEGHPVGLCTPRP